MDLESTFSPKTPKIKYLPHTTTITDNLEQETLNHSQRNKLTIFHHLRDEFHSRAKSARK